MELQLNNNRLSIMDCEFMMFRMLRSDSPLPEDIRAKLTDLLAAVGEIPKTAPVDEPEMDDNERVGVAEAGQVDRAFCEANLSDD